MEETPETVMACFTPLLQPFTPFFSIPTKVLCLFDFQKSTLSYQVLKKCFAVIIAINVV